MSNTLNLEELASEFKSDPTSLLKGCLIDTSALFAAAMSHDTYNDWAEELFDILHKNKIPIYTNVNIRSEFLDLNRRVLIPECLIELYDDLIDSIEPELKAKLKSLKQRFENAKKDEKILKLNEQEIKTWRDKLDEFILPTTELSGWEVFCRDYLDRYFTDLWEETVEMLKIEFLGVHEIDQKNQFNQRPEWKNVPKIIGSTGIGSSDAMIVNLFLSSKMDYLATTDNDIRKAVGLFAKNKKVIIPL